MSAKKWMTPKEAAFMVGRTSSCLTNWTAYGWLHPKRKNKRVIWYDQAEVLEASQRPQRTGKGVNRKVFGAEKVTPVGASMPTAESHLRPPVAATHRQLPKL